MFNKTLMATDGSENALRAARYAAALMKNNPNMSITVLTVRSPSDNLTRFYPWTSPQEIEAGIQKMAENAVKRTKEVFDEAGLQVDTDIIGGDPGKTIASYAKEKGFGQIIMGTRGLSDLSGIIMGSVSHQVLHFAECPVLLVK